MRVESDIGPNIIIIPAEVFAAEIPINTKSYKDPSEIATELHPDDAKAIEELRKNRNARNDRDAEIILFKLGVPDPNRKFTPEER